MMTMGFPRSISLLSTQKNQRGGVSARVRLKGSSNISSEDKEKEQKSKKKSLKFTNQTRGIKLGLGFFIYELMRFGTGLSRAGLGYERGERA
jgi:hypothetical protein